MYFSGLTVSEFEAKYLLSYILKRYHKGDSIQDEWDMVHILKRRLEQLRKFQKKFPRLSKKVFG